MLNKFFNKLFGKGQIEEPRDDRPAVVEPPVPQDWRPAAKPQLAPREVQEAPAPSAESLCDIDPGRMNQQEIRTRLAKLYRRHNAAAASLKPELREEAERMLTAIVICRERYLASGAKAKPGVDPDAAPE